MLVFICHNIGSWHSLFAAFAGPGVSEALCKWVVVDLQLGDLLVLVRCHRDERAFLKAHLSHVSNPDGQGTLKT